METEKDLEKDEFIAAGKALVESVENSAYIIALERIIEMQEEESMSEASEIRDERLMLLSNYYYTLKRLRIFMGKDEKSR